MPVDMTRGYRSVEAGLCDVCNEIMSTPGKLSAIVCDDCLCCSTQLDICESTIPGAGLGLFTTKHISAGAELYYKDAIRLCRKLCLTGELFTDEQYKNEFPYFHSECHYRFDDGTHLVGDWLKSPLWFINSSVKNVLKTNVQFIPSVGSDKKLICRACRNIEPGEELLANYPVPGLQSIMSQLTQTEPERFGMVTGPVYNAIEDDEEMGEEEESETEIDEP